MVLVCVIVVVGCWTAALLGGPEAAVWLAAALSAVATVTAMTRLPRRPQPALRPRRSGRDRPAQPNRFDELARTVRWASTDPRYRERVFDPLVDRLAAEAGDPARSEGIREQLASTLDGARRRRQWWT